MLSDAIVTRTEMKTKYIASLGYTTHKRRLVATFIIAFVLDDTFGEE